MKTRVVVAQVLIGLGTSLAVALVFEALRSRREAAELRLPDPLAPGHGTA